MQSYIEKQNQTILTYKYFVFYTKGGALPYLPINQRIKYKSIPNMVS